MEDHIEFSIVNFTNFSPKGLQVMETLMRLNELCGQSYLEFEFNDDNKDKFFSIIHPIIDKYEKELNIVEKAEEKPIAVIVSIFDGFGSEHADLIHSRALSMGYYATCIPLAWDPVNIHLFPSKRILSEIHKVNPLSIFVHDGCINRNYNRHVSNIIISVAEEFPMCPIYFENMGIRHNHLYCNLELDNLYSHLFETLL